MSNYILSCCSTVDLDEAHLQERDIKYLPFKFYVDGKEYTDDLGKSFPYKDFYNAMRNGSDTKTAQVNIETYVEYFRGLLSTGQDVLHVTLSTGLSGTYNSAMIAKDMLSEEFPDHKLLIVDSLGASSGSGLIMETLADMRDAGKTIDECFIWIEENKLRMHHWFFSTDLTFYIKGGRVSKTAGLFGTLLKICPLLNMDFKGRLIPREKLRGRVAARRRTLEMMVIHAENGVNYSGKCYISHSDCPEDASELKKMVEHKFPNIDGEVKVWNIGTTIGCHSGPGTVALYFWGDERKD